MEAQQTHGADIQLGLSLKMKVANKFSSNLELLKKKKKKRKKSQRLYRMILDQEEAKRQVKVMIQAKLMTLVVAMILLQSMIMKMLMMVVQLILVDHQEQEVKKMKMMTDQRETRTMKT